MSPDLSIDDKQVANEMKNSFYEFIRNGINVFPFNKMTFTTREADGAKIIFISKNDGFTFQVSAMAVMVENKKTAELFKQKINGFNDKKELELLLFEEPKVEYRTRLKL
jgi:hypothetical protein